MDEMPVVASDRIRVLLIDDDPVALQMPRDSDGLVVPWISGPPKELEDHFELLWLATAEEAREFRDLSSAISVLSPTALNEAGCLPDILSVDYRLSLNPVPVAKRRSDGLELPRSVVDQLSPLPRLRRLAESLGIHLPDLDPVEATSREDDNMGCFAGGLIYSLLAAHPCGIVAQTRHGNLGHRGISDKTEGSEARYFETLLQFETGGALRARFVQWPSWSKLIPDAVLNLRRRIGTLHRAGLVTLSPDDLVSIADGGDADSLSMDSRYGHRDLPIQGLFIDVNPEDRKRAAAQWASRALDDLVSNLIGETPASGGGEAHRALRDAISSGLELSDRLWRCYESERLTKRYLLSLLRAREQEKTLGNSLKSRLEDLAQEFGVDLAQRRPSCRDGAWCDIRVGSYAPYARRLAALFTIARLEAQRSITAATVAHHGLRAVSTNDVYLALFPAPKDPVVAPHWHDSRKDFTQSWARILQRMNDDTLDPPSLRDDSNWGNLALRIDDILRGLPWSEDPREPWSCSLNLDLEDGARPADAIHALRNLPGIVRVLYNPSDLNNPKSIVIRIEYADQVTDPAGIAHQAGSADAVRSARAGSSRAPTTWSYGLRTGERRLVLARFRAIVGAHVRGEGLGDILSPSWLSCAGRRQRPRTQPAG